MENSSNNTLLKVVVAIETLAIIGLLSVYFQSPSFLTGSLSEQECREQCENVCSGTSTTAGQVSSPATEDCSNSSDDNGNGDVDCEDLACMDDPACSDDDGTQTVTTPLVENCSNGEDDDNNGDKDCEDFACTDDPACQGSSSSAV